MNNSGFSILETMITVSLFGLLMIMAGQIFIMSMQGQRSALASGNIQESMRYALEVISKELRTAQRNSNECQSPNGEEPYFNMYNQEGVSGNEKLYFKDKFGNCITYYLEFDAATNSSRFMIDRGGISAPITPAKINVTSMAFRIKDTVSSPDYTDQGTVTILLDVSAVGQAINQQNTKIQTSISSRFYE